MPSIVIISTHSFLDNRISVGMQAIASRLADRGWKVDYVSIVSSPFDVIGRRRRERLRRVWLDKQDESSVQIKPNLREFAFRAPFPSHRFVMRYKWMEEIASCMVPQWFRNKEYDCCMFDVTPNVVILPEVRAKHFIYRFNDMPEAFKGTLPDKVMGLLRLSGPNTPKVDEIWSVTPYLEQTARKYDSGASHWVLSNGLDHRPFLYAKRNRKPKTALYVGAFESWFDSKLLDALARRLEGWQIDCYGPLSGPSPWTEGNICYKGTVSHASLPELMGRYRVGLIPFKPDHSIVYTMERPLKFYEYLASGMGIVSTHTQSLEQGMGDWANYGNSADDFAKAVLKADLQVDTRLDERADYLSQYHWDALVAEMDKRLQAIVG